MTKQPVDIVKIAFTYLSEVTAGQKISEVRIEELEPTEGKFWNLVLSYDAVGEFAFVKTREYKEFRISDEDGKVIYMRIKKI